jgi:aryl-alcohol dehydrogenase-like predicted oxidoreductase
MALVRWSPLKNGFMSGKYRRNTQVTDSAVRPSSAVRARTSTRSSTWWWRSPTNSGPTLAAVSLARLRAREGTVVPIVGARRVEHLQINLAAADVTLTPEHLRRLDEVSAPTWNYPAAMHGAQRAVLQFAGTTVDGEPATVYSRCGCSRRPVR